MTTAKRWARLGVETHPRLAAKHGNCALGFDGRLHDDDAAGKLHYGHLLNERLVDAFKKLLTFVHRKY